MKFLLDGKKLSDVLGKEISEKLNIKIEAKYSITKIKDGIFLIVEEEQKLEVQKEQKTTTEEKILKMIESLPYKKRLVGSLEKKLTFRETKALRELLKKGLIIKKKFGNFRKLVYFTKNELDSFKKKESFKLTQLETNNIQKKTTIDSKQDVPAVAVLKTEEEAKNFTKKYWKELSTGKIIGIKSFDGNYYAIRNDVYKKLEEKLFSLIKDKGIATLEEILEETKESKEKVKAALEIMKEKGLIIESRKNVFKAV